MKDTVIYPWLELAKQLQAIAQSGLEYSSNVYDIERYERIRKLSIEIMHEFTGKPMTRLLDLFAFERGYQTPKVDVRGVVFRNEKILLVKEKIDNCWSVPGGWADIGLTPFEVAVKEVNEEAGLEVIPVRLLAVLDKKCHRHPPDMYHVYKIFVLCKELGGTLCGGLETSEAQFFGLDELPPLSEPRITEEQIKRMFEFKNSPQQEAICD
jgi:ADP-ribose pyrophosphatase YjhB (NUDIX family)